MAKAKDQNTEDRILQAAREVFHRKGLGGARMAEIAEKAEINKAMLHYYFRSKQDLFQRVFEEGFGKILGQVFSILAGELPLEEKVKAVVTFYTQSLLEHPELPVFVLNAIQADAELFMGGLLKKTGIEPKKVMGTLAMQIQQEAKAGNIEPIDPRNFLLNLVGMSIFPFMMAPMLKLAFGMDEKIFEAFATGRQEHIPDFIMQAIRKQPNP
jgi:TetR/AcrR family transcriptional regulator